MTTTNGKNPAQNQTSPNAEANTPIMPLFYENPVPLDKHKHANLSLRSNFGLDFTAQVNAVPINAIEMPQICHFYPIAFAPDESATPVAILGVRDHENLFITQDGHWIDQTYIPAYIRRYPFIFSEVTGTDQLTLCVDITDKITENSREQPFFEESGEPSVLSKNALEFCKSYHAAAEQTIVFSQALAESGILVEREAQITITNKGRISFAGFRIIDEAKFAELPDQTLLTWRSNGWLPFVYAHLFSSTQWQRLTRLLNARIEQEAS